MEVDASALGAARGRGGRDVDGAFDRLEETPEGCGGAVAEDCSFAAGERCRHPAPVPAQASVSHGVDAAVDSMEAATSHPFGDRWSPESHCCELPRGDHSVLQCRDSSDRQIERVAFVRHIRTKSTGPSTPPPYPAFFVPVSVKKRGGLGALQRLGCRLRPRRALVGAGAMDPRRGV